MTGLSILATLQAELGDLDRIERIIRVLGMVNCAPGLEPDAGGSVAWSSVLSLERQSGIKTTQ
jgi:hypothetical protein